MKIAVAGANGFTGRLLIPLIKDAGHTPVAMIRDHAQREALEALGAECTFGDLEKPVGYAVRGCRAAMFAAGSGSKTGPEKTIDVDQNGAIAMIDTCVRMNVRRFIMLSSVAADTPENAPEGLHHYLSAKAAADAFLRQSGLDYTILRPAYLTHEPGTGKIEIAPSVGKIEKGVHIISRADVAATMVACLAHENTIEKTFEMIAGDTPIDEALAGV